MILQEAAKDSIISDVHDDEMVMGDIMAGKATIIDIRAWV